MSYDEGVSDADAEEQFTLSDGATGLRRNDAKDVRDSKRERTAAAA